MEDAVTFRHGLDDRDRQRTSTPVEDAEFQTYMAKKQVAAADMRMMKWKGW
jgi:hypothetical protein